MAPLAQGLETGVAAIDAANDGLRFLLERMFQPGVECRKGAHGNGECDFRHCSRIDAIIRYVDRNFASQERVMTESAYPEATRHCDDHARLLDGLTIMLKTQICADRDSGKVHDMVAHWMIDHAKGHDAPFGRWAVTRRVLGPHQ